MAVAAAVTPRPTAAPTAKVIYTGTSITRELYRGCTGEDVETLQDLLNQYGYALEVDGEYGSKTRGMVIAFQKNNGLKADGIAGARTIRALAGGAAVVYGETPAPRTSLSYGMSGQDVLELQYRLGFLGYYFDAYSGKYLTNTRNAVAWFQKVNGPATLSRVYSAAAIPAGSVPLYPSPTPHSLFTRTLYEGLSGPDVGYLQQLLSAYGYFSGPATNYFGQGTKWSVATFQSFNGLFPDGIAGSATFGKLLSGNAVPYPGGPVPTPTPAPPPANICVFCSQWIASGDEARHQTIMACGHRQCQENNGQTHAPSACGVVGHYICMDGVHTPLPCGLHWSCVQDAANAWHTRACVYCGTRECQVYGSEEGCTGSGSPAGFHLFQ